MRRHFVRALDWALGTPLAPLLVIGATLAAGACLLVPTLAVAFAFGA